MGGSFSMAQSGTEGLAGWFGVEPQKKAKRPPNPQVDRAEAEKEAVVVQEDRRKRLATGGRQSTIHTSRAGAFGTTSQKKELLGE